MNPDAFSWIDTEDIAEALMEAYPAENPMSLRFTQLRDMVEKLDNFEPEPGQACNEAILEAIQGSWIELWQEEH